MELSAFAHTQVLQMFPCPNIQLWTFEKASVRAIVGLAPQLITGNNWLISPQMSWVSCDWVERSFPLHEEFSMWLHSLNVYMEGAVKVSAHAHSSNGNTT